MADSVLDMQPQVLERLKTAFEKAYGMFWSDTQDRDMIIEHFIIRVIALGSLVRSDDPCIYLPVVLNWWI